MWIQFWTISAPRRAVAGGGMNGDGENWPQRGSAGKKSVLRIPSYQRATEIENRSSDGSSSNSSAAPRTGDSSFSQAFSFVKNSELYTPPPPPPDASSTPDHALRDDCHPVAASSSSSTNFTSQNRNAILVSHRQKGNPLLKHIRNVRWMFADIVCDYLLGQTSCALYISLRYHLLHPDYLYYRIRELQKNYKLRVVLCHVDVVDVAKPLLEVTRTSLLHDCSLLCGWSLEECGRYLETIKVYENKSADSIREQMDTDYISRLTHALTTIRHVNKTDVITLGSTFGSLSGIIGSSMEDLARCPGIGEQKVRRLYDTFHKPFRRVASEPTLAGDSAPSKADETVDVERRQDSTENREEANLTVKSALSIAFAKYSSKIRSSGRKSNILERETEIEIDGGE